MKNFDEILFRKHCKEGAFVVTHFLPHKKIMKTKKKKKTKCKI
jgi:hypothetical protein